MKFQYSCIGDNSQENREWLEKVGYSLGTVICDGANIIVTEGDFCLLAYEHINKSNYINCIGNPQLFQAVSAISTKTDIGKYYINNHTGQWRKCTHEMATDENIDWSDWTEASLDELQEHFK